MLGEVLIIRMKARRNRLSTVYYWHN